MGSRVRVAARPLLVSWGLPAGLPVFTAIPHRRGDVSLELEGPWAGHSSFRNSSSSSESVSAVKVVFNKGKSQSTGDGRGLVSLFHYSQWFGEHPGSYQHSTARSKCLPAMEQAGSHFLELSSRPGPLALTWEASKPQTSHSSSSVGLNPGPFQIGCLPQRPPHNQLLSRTEGGGSPTLSRAFPWSQRSSLSPAYSTGLHPARASSWQGKRPRRKKGSGTAPPPEYQLPGVCWAGTRRL